MAQQTTSRSAMTRARQSKVKTTSMHCSPQKAIRAGQGNTAAQLPRRLVVISFFLHSSSICIFSSSSVRPACTSYRRSHCSSQLVSCTPRLYMAVAASKCLPALPAAAAPQRRARYYLLRCRCSESEDNTLLPGVPLSREKQRRLVFPANSIRPPPLRPRRIVLVRHGESEGNVDESAYTRIPDPRIGLTAKGRRDAELCGRHLRDLFSSSGGGGDDDWKVYFYVSPYRRGLETLRGIGHSFEPHRIAGVREEPRIREQDFGNFQDREQMRVEKELRLRYGRFFYRFPNGESAADVYDRITGFRETLRADIDIGRFEPPGRSTPNMNIVIVSHGLTLRVFLMRWYKWTVRQFEGLNNLGNGGVLVMQAGQGGGRYSLLVHHSADELREFGLTDEMIQDQMWQRTARPEDLNHTFMTNGQSFFDRFDAMPSHFTP